MIKTFPSRRQGTRYLVRGALLSVAMVGLSPTAGYAVTIRDPYCHVSQQAWQVYDVEKFCDLVNKDLAEGRMPDLLARLEESRRVPQPPPTVSRPTVSAKPRQQKKPPDVASPKNDRTTPSRNVQTTPGERPATPPSRVEKAQSSERHRKPVDHVTEKPSHGKAIRAKQDEPRSTPTATPSPVVPGIVSPRPAITPGESAGHVVPSPRASNVTTTASDPLIVPIGKALLYGMAVAGAAALLLHRLRPTPARAEMIQGTEIDPGERQDKTKPSTVGLAVPATTSAPVPESTPRPECNQVDGSLTLVTVRVLDQVTVYGPAGNADCSRGKDVADLLGLLVVHRDGLTRERAYQVLWPDITLDHYDCFHGPKSELRDRLVRVLGRPNQGKNLLQYVGGRYRLNPALVTADLWQLLDALAEAKQANNPEQVIASLHRAVDLYPGPFLPAGTHPWVGETAEDLRHDVIQALLRLSELDPDVDRVTAVLERAHRLDPVNEQVSCRMMSHFSALGRNDAVYVTYRDLCQVLAELDGLSPSAKTRELYGKLTGHAS
ncbi:BTAD domain-containing putative transcriptional regulator [Microtetraspora sp. NBRC 16547]|uniref:AfsR/SARP family transcriptional regulator n=1 Tax=Microtetraspora sp. NBRC 16547 TaxID=3030993 RepID=UPI0024A40274|nr:BTAD domain-containing putative transcriptional regulator [Microtetraspora sp. NBRC 16547]GLW98775.1 hypothetical protein Misp02_28620 [Microtetraspora sp. NBRC 16547]